MGGRCLLSEQFHYLARLETPVPKVHYPFTDEKPVSVPINEKLCRNFKS